MFKRHAVPLTPLLTPLILSLLIPLALCAAGGVKFDGSTDYLDCGSSVTFNATDDQVSMLAYVSPNFAQTATGDKYVWSNIDTALPKGGSIWFKDTINGFRFNFADRNTPGAPKACDAIFNFSAGHLIGLYGFFSNNLQQCEGINFTTGLGGTGNTFFSWGVENSGATMQIGAHVGTLFWDGSIYQLILADGRIKNTNNNQLVGMRKRRHWPMWTGTHGLNGGGGTKRAVLNEIWNLEEGNVGDEPTSWLDLGLADAVSDDCSVGAGTPEAVATIMLP